MAKALALLLCIGALAAGEVGQPVPLPDPYHLGERLVLIDHLRHHGETIAPDTALSELRRRYWTLNAEPASLRDEDLPSSEVLLMHLDAERRAKQRLARRIATLEAAIASQDELRRRIQSLETALAKSTAREAQQADLSQRLAAQDAEILQLRARLRQRAAASVAPLTPPPQPLDLQIAQGPPATSSQPALRLNTRRQPPAAPPPPRPPEAQPPSLLDRLIIGGVIGLGLLLLGVLTIALARRAA